jgi:ATP-binding cassette subfamily B multidrug efflux pump
MAQRQSNSSTSVSRAEAGAARAGGVFALRRALSYLESYKFDAASASLSLVIVSAANLVAPQLMRNAIDNGVANKRMAAVVISVAGLCMIAAGRALFTFLQGYLAERASQGVAYDLRVALFDRIQRLSFSYYDRVHTGQLLTRLTSDVEQIRAFISRGFIQLMAAVILLVGSVVILIVMNWRLALVSLATIPLSLMLLFLVGRRVGQLFGRIQKATARLTTVLQEDLTGMKVIRTFVREQHEIERFDMANKVLLERNMDFLRSFSGVFPFVLLSTNLGTLAVVWYGGWEAIGGRLTIGEIVAFFSYLSFLHFTVIMIGFGAGDLPRAAAASARVFEILDARLEVCDAADAKPLPEIRGRVEFRQVYFRYPGSSRQILNGISFTAEPGQKVALVGRIGAGKSTATNLLPRFYDATSGSVLIDGHDVRGVTLASLRSQIGVVLQETLLFSGSVRDNIAYGKPDATLQEIKDAAAAAQAHGFIEDLPRGYDTIIGERGAGLSGGERQRIAIARAILIDPKLLILDDGTSSVDAKTELAILGALSRLMHEGRRTVIVIAHRLSTVRDADIILALEDGRIAAQGTHQTLLRESPLYNELLGSQILTEPARGPVMRGASFL